MEFNGQPFLAFPYNLCLMLNVDWFQPFKKTTYSVGAMYISIQNLPREERYLSDNVIIVGVIPGPKEPEKTMNSFLQPLVSELLDLWKGVVMKNANGSSVIVRAALTCIACDIPALRKVCGFLGHSARLGCSKCLKEFPTKTFGEKCDYSGFDQSLWPIRSLEIHRYYAYKFQDARTRAGEIKIQKEGGCRFSVLLELPYFDPIRMSVVDPMHNLLLGTSKHMMNVWTTLKLIDHKQLLTIQEIVDNFVTPSDVGRIPNKIASNFSAFTAEQWRNWTILFSLSALKDILPREHYNCWHLYVRACHLLCRRQISVREVQDADTLLNSFCVTFENLYGKEFCTINLHLHGHLAACIQDFGPVYSFWLFAYERLNGVLESFHTNSHNIAPQLMRKFLDIHTNGMLHWPNESKEQFIPLLERHRFNKGSLSQTSLETAIHQHLKEVSPLPPLVETSLEPYEMDSLQSCISRAKVVSGYFTILPLIRKCAAINIKGYNVGSGKSRYTTSSIVMASSLVVQFSASDSDQELKLAEIQYFFWCDISTEGTIKSYCFVGLSYFIPHPCKEWYGHPTQVWSAVTTSSVEIVPINFIKSRVSYAVQRVDFGGAIGEDKVIVVSPLATQLNP